MRRCGRLRAVTRLVLRLRRARCTRCDGFEAGGTFGWFNMTIDFGGSTSSMIAYMLRDTTIENEFSPSSWATLPKDVSNSCPSGAFICAMGSVDAGRRSRLEPNDLDADGRRRNKVAPIDDQRRLRQQRYGDRFVVGQADRLRDTPRPRRPRLQPVSVLCNARRHGDRPSTTR